MTTGLDNDTLEWAAQWIEGSLKGEEDQRVREFGRNMATTLRAAKLPEKCSCCGAAECDCGPYTEPDSKVIDDPCRICGKCINHCPHQ